jgi:Fe-S-cluster containining protein
MSTDVEPIAVADVTEQPTLPAGEFSSWLRNTRNAQAGDDGAEVPCGGCNACCKASYFIHIRPDETEALARIPKALLFPAPGLPRGNVVMGYDEHGHCPMLVDDNCSIYEQRPITCRRFDCRVFPAAGIATREDEKALVANRARRWKFSYPTESDRDQHSAVRAATKFLTERAECFPNGVPNNSTQLAILAIKVYEVFLEYVNKPSKPGHLPPDPEIAQAVVDANENFEAGINAS